MSWPGRVIWTHENLAFLLSDLYSDFDKSSHHPGPRCSQLLSQDLVIAFLNSSEFWKVLGCLGPCGLAGRGGCEIEKRRQGSGPHPTSA